MNKLALKIILSFTLLIGLYYSLSDNGDINLTIVTYDRVPSEVYSDGELIGLTDSKDFTLPAEKINLVIKRKHHKDYLLTINESEGDVLRVIKPDPITGTLILNTNIDNYSVYIDDKKINPLSKNTYPAIIGTHTLKIKKHDYSTWEREITLAEGETLEISPKMELTYGYLVVRSNLWGDHFSVDGVNYGSTGSAHYMIDTGEREIKISKYNFAPYIRTITIKPGKVTVIKAILHPESQTERGIRMHDENRYEEALEVLTPLAEQDDATAQEYVAIMHDQGLGMPEANPQAGFRWYTKSAYNGNSNAQLALGEAFLYGVNTEKDLRKARRWLKKSGNQGNPIAEYQLGRIYLDGIGVEQDKERAFKWIRRSAKHDHTEAQLSLGLMYLRGTGVDENEEKGRKWINEALGG